MTARPRPAALATGPDALPLPDRTAGPYRAEAGLGVADFLRRCERLRDGAALPFHGSAWLSAWLATLGVSDGRQPLLVAVRHRHSGADAALLPLVRQRRAGLWWVEFADAGVVDYNAPLLAADWAGSLRQPDAARHLWAALRAALRSGPGRNDVLHLVKMLPCSLDEAGGQPNPLALALPTQRCEMFGNQFSVQTDWESWRRSLDKRVRKEIERSWRVFTRSPDARFERVTDPARAQALFNTLAQQQSARMQGHASGYRLDGPAFGAFYRQLLEDGLEDGLAGGPAGDLAGGLAGSAAGGPGGCQVVLTALMDGPQVVSAMLGVANQHRYIGLRQSLGGPAWKNCSPGRLLDDQTASHLHAQGLRHFDFGIGDYAHKDALRMTPIPLRDACVALSAWGVAAALAWRARRSAKRQAWLVALVRLVKLRLRRV